MGSFVDFQFRESLAEENGDVNVMSAAANTRSIVS